MDITIRKDPDPDVEFYFRVQFEIYRESYLLWEREIWEAVTASCDVFRIEVGGKYGGDIILEDRGKGTEYIVDISILPEHQQRGIGTAVLRHFKARSRRLLAITREETLPFFLKSGFMLRRRIKSYYDRGVDGYYVEYSHPVSSAGKPRVMSARIRRRV